MKKLAVISGGSKGIGKALIDKFLLENFDVISCARNINIAKDVQKKLEDEYPGSNIAFIKADLSVKKEVEEFADFILQSGNKVDVLINNAGLYIPGQVHNEEDGVLENMINTNLYSAYYLTRKLISSMISKKSGHIFNICSTASIMPYVNGGSYCISKYALLGMTKVLREEMKPYDVKVTAVMPGATFTASWEGVDIPKERFMKPEDVANAIYGVYALSSHTVVEEILLRPQLGDL